MYWYFLSSVNVFLQAKSLLCLAVFFGKDEQDSLFFGEFL